MEADLMFHSVGQGLFYTGQIRCQDESFNFVYDCGTTSGSTANAIKKYKRYLNKKAIDMLVISHFHSDHTSGIPSLLDKQSIKTVIIPYLTFEERLEILIHEYNSKTSVGHIEFLLNPYEYFAKNNVEKIIVVVHNENHDGIQERNIIDLDEIILDIPENDKYSELLSIGRRNIGLMTDDKLIQKNCLRFAFYTDKKHKSRFDFSKAVQQIDNLKHAKNNLDRINAINELKKSYKVRSKVLNETSLIMVHQFDAMFKNIHPLVGIQNKKYASLPVFMNTDKHIHILTGDFQFNGTNAKSSWVDVLNHFGSFLKNANVSIKQISHHGSKDNWDSDILNHTPQKNLCVIPYGTKNTYGHPDIDVVQDILLANGQLIEVTESQSLILLYR